MDTERIYRYPTWIKWAIELLCTIAVVVSLALFGRNLLLYSWVRWGLDTSLFRQVPFLPETVQWISNGQIEESPFTYLSDLLPSLGWLALVLLLVLLLRNSLPAIRTSPRGMLVEFVGDWLPVPWEMLTTVKVTEDLGAERFVLLAQTERGQLTGWHRFYSFIYSFGFRRGFLITSAISDFNDLIKTLLSETDRVARVLETGKRPQVQEDASSPLFRFLLGPASFFSRRTKTEEGEVAPYLGASAAGNLLGTYPRRITLVLSWGTSILAALMLVHYVFYWLRFAALLLPELRSLPVFDRLDLRMAHLVAPWWILVAGHLMVLIMIGLLVAIRHLLPDLEARGEGLAVRYFNTWRVVPWAQIKAIKVTEFSEESQIVLVQTRGQLPMSSLLGSLIYDGSFSTGVLVTSAISNFEPLLQRIVVEVTKHQPAGADEESPIFRDDSPSPLLWLSFRAGTAIDWLVAHSRDDEETTQVQAGQLLRAAGPMIAVAAAPALLAFVDRSLRLAIVPDPGLIGGVIALFLLGLLEWPIVCIGMQALDEMGGDSEEGARALYLYPLVQLPRLIPLGVALLLSLLGLPLAVALLLWLAAIGWSFLLSAGLWEALYDWRGTQLLTGGLVPVAFQLLLLTAYLVVLQ